MADKKAPNSRLVKAEKAQFTGVNEHFSGKHNAEVGVFLQTQCKKRKGGMPARTNHLK